MLKLTTDKHEESRISAAIAVMRCPSVTFVDHVKTQLNVNLRTQVKHLIVRIYLSKLITKLYVTYYSY